LKNELIEGKNCELCGQIMYSPLLEEYLEKRQNFIKNIAEEAERFFYKSYFCEKMNKAAREKSIEIFGKRLDFLMSETDSLFSRR